MNRASRVFLLALTAVLAVAVGAGDAAAKPPKRGGGGPVTTVAWAPASTATIHPGVQVRTETGQCTANFVYTDAQGGVYLGMAAHCSSLGTSTQTNGCTTPSRALGSPVKIAGQYDGTLAYSSWLAMQRAGETDRNACEANDFALIRIAAADVARVNPSVPFWGGPVGLNTSGTAAGETVYSYGNSSLRRGVTTVSPKQGTSYGTNFGGWNHPVVTYPATDIPGDSGSALLDRNGSALGVLSRLSVTVAFPTGTGVADNYADVSRGIAYANTHGMNGLQLVLGTEPFNPLP